MREQLNINNKSNSDPSTSVHHSLNSRPFTTQRVQDSNAVHTQQEITNQQYQQNKLEATKLEIQTKYGKITPEGQQRLTVLQAKMPDFRQEQLKKAQLYSRNFSKIPLHRTDVPLKQAIQTKLTVGQPGDKYEQEADRVAEQFVNQIDAPVAQQSNQNLQREEPEISNIQREVMPEQEEELQMKPMLQLRSAVGGMTATADLETAINQARGGGQPLAKSIRKPMERFLRADFSGVKVHTDTNADQLNQSLQARAFTTGQDIFFRRGEYNPGTRSGKELIAHEVAHVPQQNGNTVQRTLKARLTKAKLYLDNLTHTITPTGTDATVQFGHEFIVIFDVSIQGWGNINPASIKPEWKEKKEEYTMENNQWVLENRPNWVDKYREKPEAMTFRAWELNLNNVIQNRQGQMFIPDVPAIGIRQDRPNFRRVLHFDIGIPNNSRTRLRATQTLELTNGRITQQRLEVTQ